MSGSPSQGSRSAHAAALADRADGLAHSRVAEMQRARMLSAMLEMCAERGAVNVTVADVVSRAGVSRRTFYELFADGEGCLLATLDHALAAAAERVVGAYDSAASAGAAWRERVRAGLVALLEFLDDEPLMGRLLIVESLGAGRRVFERRVRALSPVIDAIDQGRSATPRTTATPLTAEATVGGVLSVIHSRIVERHTEPLLGLVNQLMSMIALPYLGAAAARRELQRPALARKTATVPAKEALKALEIRVTYRTMSVLVAIGERPGASNRAIAHSAGIEDQGQISKLLSRLRQRGLIENAATVGNRGAPNAWRLTDRGEQVRQALLGPFPQGR